MIVEPGQEYVLVAIAPVSIHGDTYYDVEIGDPAGLDDPRRRLRTRLGPEAVEGDPAPGDRVRVEGFLQMVTRVARI
ncbi:MAG TPA: hypothetical protein VM778_03405 [Gemmatimonadota bacterium]|nr:hypothetical protein [Gemmatimonadota bacterium]